MCIVVILRRPEHAWPVIIGANRDEMRHRAWLPPGRHWDDRPDVVAGQDCVAGGSWLGVNDHGLVAAILNRRNSLGPAQDKRSRGELVLDALDHAEASSAADALSAINPDAYRTFNLLVADSYAAFWIRHDGENSIEAQPVPDGLSMITAHGLNDMTCARVNHHLPRFANAPPPDLATGDAFAWEALLASERRAPDGDPKSAMRIAGDGPFGTVNASIVALASPGRTTTSRTTLLFADGPPGVAPFEPIPL